MARAAQLAAAVIALVLVLSAGRGVTAKDYSAYSPASPTSVVPASNPDIASGGYTGPNDPNLQACQAARGDCNPAALAIIKANNPPYQPPSVNPQYLSRAAVEEAARRGARTPLTPEAPSSSIVYSALIPRSQFLAFTHEAGNPNLDISYRRFKVIPPDPHGFDGDHDGIGCKG